MSNDIRTYLDLSTAHVTEEVMQGIKGVPGVAHAENHPDPMLAGAWQALQSHKPGTRGFSFGPYLAMVAEFPPESGIDWRVIGGVAAFTAVTARPKERFPICMLVSSPHKFKISLLPICGRNPGS